MQEAEGQQNHNQASAKTKYPSPLFIFLMALIFGFVGGIGGTYTAFKYLGTPVKQMVKEEVKTQVVDESSAIIDTVEKTKDAVVSIVISKDVPVFENYRFDPFGDGFFFPFYQRKQVGTEKQQVGAGTGFFVSDDGTIVTNKHVVSDPDAEYTVILNNGEKYDAKVLDRDPYIDIAVIKVAYKPKTYISLGDSSKIKVGQRVIAIGNSLGQFSNTVSEGIISGLSRSIVAGSGTGNYEQLNDVIQTDAAINPGNSGGPLLDLNGNAIGVNVAVAQNAENIGFAIPINTVKSILQSIKEHGKIVHPYLGVRYVQINKDIQKKNNLSVDYGALIVRGETRTDLAVIPGSPADKAGLRENDIILEVNGVKLDEKTSLQREILKYNVGDEITLKVLSKGKEKEVKVTLEAREG